MSDLISRQEAIRLAEQGQIQGFEWQFKKLCTLPSAEPERKKGKWIEYTDCEGKSRRITCDQCGHEEWNWLNPNFCPNCGSYNGGEQE